MVWYCNYFYLAVITVTGLRVLLLSRKTPNRTKIKTMVSLKNQHSCVFGMISCKVRVMLQGNKMLWIKQNNHVAL